MALSWTAYLLYHIRIHLSRGFQNFFQKSFEPVVREAFIRPLPQGLLIISHFLPLVKGVVKIFFGGLTGWLPVYPALSLPSCPYPPRPLPSGKGENHSFLMQGASPLASPGLGGKRHWRWEGGSDTPAGACPSGCRSTLPLAYFAAPIPPAPFPSGEGGES